MDDFQRHSFCNRIGHCYWLNEWDRLCVSRCRHESSGAWCLLRSQCGTDSSWSTRGADNCCRNSSQCTGAIDVGCSSKQRWKRNYRLRHSVLKQQRQFMGNFCRLGLDCHIGNGDGANKWNCLSLPCCSEKCSRNRIEFIKFGVCYAFHGSSRSNFGFGIKWGSTI